MLVAQRLPVASVQRMLGRSFLPQQKRLNSAPTEVNVFGFSYLDRAPPCAANDVCASARNDLDPMHRAAHKARNCV
jgi:hypothetical protein